MKFINWRVWPDGDRPASFTMRWGGKFHSPFRLQVAMICLRKAMGKKPNAPLELKACWVKVSLNAPRGTKVEPGVTKSRRANRWVYKGNQFTELSKANKACVGGSESTWARGWTKEEAEAGVLPQGPWMGRAEA